jgi:hypothetical protein
LHISCESEQQTEKRLGEVLRSATVTWFDGTYGFETIGGPDSLGEHLPEALALVRDGEVWSMLTRAQAGASEPVRLFSVHFPDALDNSGFVGWLATHVKRATGSGLFVVCGQNPAKGGIYDYWGIPVVAAGAVEDLIGRLRDEAWRGKRNDDQPGSTSTTPHHGASDEGGL